MSVPEQAHELSNSYFVRDLQKYAVEHALQTSGQCVAVHTIDNEVDYLRTKFLVQPIARITFAALQKHHQKIKSLINPYGATKLLSSFPPEKFGRKTAYGLLMVTEVGTNVLLDDHSPEQSATADIQEAASTQYRNMEHVLTVAICPHPDTCLSQPDAFIAVEI